MAEQEDSNINKNINAPYAGINMDQSINQIPKGKLTYALNAAVENFDANSVNYQNEPGNELCLNFPEGYKLIGKHFIPEQNKHIFFLSNPITNDSEIGYMDNNDCIYHTFINSPCLNFSIKYPILKSVHKITNCSTEVYWPDQNGRRFIDLNNPPYKTRLGDDICENVELTEVDCNKIKVQPDVSIPSLSIQEIISGGRIVSGTYQFAIQYCDVAGDPYTSYYSITNPLPIADNDIVTPDFNYPVGKSIILNITGIDTTGYYKYFNLAVIKTINNIPSVELIGTYFIENNEKQVLYSGQNQEQIRLTINDIFEKYPTYEIANDVTTVQDVIVWKGLTSVDRINYQKIANQIELQWQTWRIPATEDYSNELNATNLRSCLRDEIYPYEIVFILNTAGKQTDAFHIPGRKLSYLDLQYPDVLSSDPDYIETGTSAPYWKIYNTANVEGTESTSDPDYKGPHQYGQFSYWESTETYPCNEEVWGELAGQPIRHHKFPDVKISPIFESDTPNIDSGGQFTGLNMDKRAIYPIGVRLNVSDVQRIIEQSELTREQKDSIVGFKIVRGDRSTNKSIVAKGILRNVGKYNREGTDYYFPNYPYNDLREDPFLLSQPNAYNGEVKTYTFTPSGSGTYEYTDPYTGKREVGEMTNGTLVTICSLTKPVQISGTTGTITLVLYDLYELKSVEGVTTFSYSDPITSDLTNIILEEGETRVIAAQVSTTPSAPGSTNGKYLINEVSYLTNPLCYPSNLEAFTGDENKYRQVFNSPETSFGQPFLGDILKLESVLFGKGKGHFVEVKKNALYKFLSKEIQNDALIASDTVASIGTFSGSAMFTAYQAYLQIYLNGITRKNYGWSYNSIADYNYSSNIDNGLGIKQRKLDNIQYLYSGVQSIGEQVNFNNYQRESSIYLKTNELVTALPYPKDTNSLLLGTINKIEDQSRYTSSQQDCNTPNNEFDLSVVSYYASIKNYFPNQWGQIYSYETIDTGAQVIFDRNEDSYLYIFGGDTFINRFSFKTKLPFFIDNRVGAPDDSDINYDEIGNIAYPEYWHSSRSILFDYNGTHPMKNAISVKAHYLDCPNNQLPEPDSATDVVNPDRSYYDGKMYMFAYGIPTFYCESSVNVDLRQAFNNREGDFYPHVSSGIPDDWVQESNVTIAQDNTYYYNVSYSKQNKENFFSHLPFDWTDQLCYTTFPFRAIYSEAQQSFTDNRINSWLIYKPTSFFDFPQNYGELTSIDGVDNRQVLARFVNKSMIYNALYTNETNVQGQVYLGQPLFSKGTPPLDFVETDLGYAGSQHKFLLKIPQGQISIDAKRGQVFLLNGNTALDLSGFGSGLNRFFTDHLSFEIIRYFPEINIDNHFNGIGLHGVYDSKYDRVIITKLDYVPVSEEVKYDSTEDKFYINRMVGETAIKTYVDLNDIDYFCNKSWTVSYNINTKSWISFHTYLPNFYIGENNFFYSGINESCNFEAICGTIASCDLSGYLENCTLNGTAIITGLDCEITAIAEAQYDDFLLMESGDAILGENGEGIELE